MLHDQFLSLQVLELGICLGVPAVQPSEIQVPICFTAIWATSANPLICSPTLA